MKNKISTWVFTLYVGGIKYEYEVQAESEEEAEQLAFTYYALKDIREIGEECND